MIKTLMLLVFVLNCAVVASRVAAEPQTREVSPFFPMRNKDVLLLMERKLTPPEEIIAVIKFSWCNFDTFPPVLQELKRRGVPAEVLQAMAEAPYGPPAIPKRGGAGESAFYHYAEEIKQKGLFTWSAVRREDQNGGFSPDRRGAGGILRR